MSDNNSIFEPAIDKKVEISYDSLPNSSFEDVNLGGAKFSNVNLKEAVFDDVNMDETFQQRQHERKRLCRYVYGKHKVLGRKSQQLEIWLLYHEQC